MSDDISRAQASEMFASMMGEGAPPEEQDSATTEEDNLTSELRGDDSAPNDSPESEEATAEDEGGAPTDVLEKLRKAQRDAGKAGYELGQARKELSEKDQMLQALEARIAAIEGRSQQQPNQQQQSQTQQPIQLPPEQIDAVMSEVDPKWAQKAESDPIYRDIAGSIVPLMVEAVRSVQNEVKGVMGGMQDMQFSQRLSQLGIDREAFDAIWQDPAYSWGQPLSNEQRLAALESQARIPGSRPSGAGAGPNAGAPTTSRVDPRKTIEPSHNVGSANDPRRLSQLKMHQALEENDMKSATKAATPLFQQLMGS